MAILGQQAIRVADFFSGCGGTSAGLRSAGMEVVFGLDFEPYSAATFRRNFPEAKFIERDIRLVAPEEVAKLVEGTGPLLVAACAPCQPYSSFVRRRRATTNDHTLLLRLVPFLELIRPQFRPWSSAPTGQRPEPGF
jgi:DNA (cytosine-5)-methyltransferase 1